LIESASLRRWKRLKALRGTGVETSAPPVLPLPPPPPEELELDAREVPLDDVFALEEMLLPVLVLDSTVERVLAVEEGDSAEVELAFVDKAVAVFWLAAARADVEDAADERAPPEEGFRSVPEDEDEAAPAPDDEPAVCDCDVEEELGVKEDWM